MTATTMARKRFGAASVTNNAMPTDTGSAIATAITATTAVPNKKASAPNLPSLGIHCFEVRKPKPVT